MDIHYQDFNPNSINPFYRSPDDFRLFSQWFYLIALLPALPPLQTGQGVPFFPCCNIECLDEHCLGCEAMQ